MGSLCGKESSTSSAPAGRVLGSASGGLSTAGGTSRIPASASKKPKIGGPGRTLGTGDEAPADAREAARLAAEARVSNSAAKNGKLGAQLNEQKRKTQNQHLNELGNRGQQESLVWD